MTQGSLLADDVLRRLIGVGQVDIVVGVPTMNHADTITGILDVVERGLTLSFPRARTVVIAADGGSDDGTLDAVEASRTAERASGLRTRHRLGAAYRGVPGRAGAIRLVCTAADLLQAQAIAILDPDARGLSPDWLGSLLAPVSSGAFDVVAGLHERDPLEGLLVSQLIRPLMRAAYQRQFEQPLFGAYACSRRFAATVLVERDAWNRSPTRDGIDVWLTGAALSGEFRLAQTWLGPSHPRPRHPPPGLHDVFEPLIATLFANLEGTDDDREKARLAVGVVGNPRSPMDADRAKAVPSGLGDTFATDVRDVRPVLERILSSETLAVLSARAEEFDGGVMRYEDDLWVSTVYEFVAAYRAGAMDRGHVVQALMPLYRGRAAAFVSEHARATAADTEERLETLGRRFEQRRQELNRAASPQTVRTG